MGVISYSVSTTGLVPNTTGLGLGLTQQTPTIIYLETNNTLAQVLVTGYLNQSRTDFQIPYNNQNMALVYTTDQGTVWLSVVVSGTNYSLQGTTNVSTVYEAALGSAAAPSYTFVGRTDTGLYSGAAHEIDVTCNSAKVAAFTTSGLAVTGLISSTTTISAGTNLSAGSSGTAGTITAFPATASNGKVVISPVGNAGNFTSTVSDISSLGQASVYTLPDPGAATANFIISASGGTQTIATGNLALTVGTLTLGSSNHASSLTIYPPTAANGFLEILPIAAGGAFNTIISNGTMGQTTTYTIPDAGNTLGRFLVAATATPFVSGNLVQASGTGGLTVDSGITGASVSSAITQLGQLYQISVTLNTAQVVASYATPIVLIPAVAGKVAIVHSANVYTASTGNTAFATGVAPIIQYGATVHGAGTIATGTGLLTGDITAAASQVRTIGPAASAVYTGITNTGVYFSCTTAYTAGTGTSVTFTLVYELITATI